MKMQSDLVSALQGKDNKEVYALVKEVYAKSAESNEFYRYFDVFISLLGNPNSYIRTRGFVLACAQARWDEEKRLQANMDLLLQLLYDEKPTVVRQCLAALHEVVLFRPELMNRINSSLDTMDLSKYKDSMSPLLKKDIAILKRAMNL